MALKIVIALGLVAIVIIVAAVAIHLMNKKEKDEITEPIPTFDFNFDGKCHCEHCEHNNEKGDE